jgi:hypothetical protein
MLLPLVLLAGCVAGPELKTAFTAPANDYLTVDAVHAYPHKEGLIIFGEVQASRSRTMPVNAHLHITGKFKDGTPPVTSDTRWGTIPVRGSRRASFSALLRTIHPELIDTIAVDLREAPDKRD